MNLQIMPHVQLPVRDQREEIMIFKYIEQDSLIGDKPEAGKQLTAWWKILFIFTHPHRVSNLYDYLQIVVITDSKLLDKNSTSSITLHI